MEAGLPREPRGQVVREFTLSVLKSPAARHRRVSSEGKGERLGCCTVHVSVPAHLCNRFVTAESAQAGVLTGLMSSSCSVQLTVSHHSTSRREGRARTPGRSLEAGTEVEATERRFLRMQHPGPPVHINHQSGKCPTDKWTGQSDGSMLSVEPSLPQ